MIKTTRNKIIVLAAMAAALCLAFHNVVFAEGRAVLTVNSSGENRYKSVRLTPKIYNNSHISLYDILITDENGENRPYFIHSSFQTVNDATSEYPLELVNAYVKDNASYFDYKAEMRENEDIAATSVEFTSPDSNFAKNVEALGGYDGVHWEYIQNDQLYKVNSSEKMSITFDDVQRYVYYRFKLLYNAENISFSEASLLYREKNVENIFFVESFDPAFKVRQGDGRTYIDIYGLKNLRLADVNILTENMFKRDVESSLGTVKTLYNLSLNGESYSDATLTFDHDLSTDDVFTLTIYDGDDSPIDINGVTVRYYADEIIFDGSESARYMISFGDPDASEPPEYDIKSYKDEILKGGVDALVMDERAVDAAIERMADVTEEKKRDYTIVFNIVILAAAASLGAVIVSKLRKKNV
ncbi:MAG: hypothetical protein LBL35_07900 [Clostridiales bacterium]|nr:hypothetical protein [Clostridiales bacterium]